MSKRIKPNVEHRIVDGEIIAGSIDEKILRGQTFSQEKAQEHTPENSVTLTMPADMSNEAIEVESDQSGTSTSNGDDMKNTEEKVVKKPSFFSRFRNALLWILLFIIVIVMLFITRPNTDWQVQKINDLQSQMSQLKEDNNDLNTRLREQQAHLEQLITDQVQKATQNLAVNNSTETASANSDISEFEQKIQTQIDVLHKELSSLSGSAAQQADEALTEINKLADKAQKNLQPSNGEQQQALNVLQSQMQSIGDKLKELFAFKAEQQILTKNPPVLKLDMPLDSLQIQQWIVELNTQWMLNGRPDQTQQQLLAFEQAVSLSDFKYTTQLARLIGQDLGYLKQIKEDRLRNPLPQTASLKKAINNLTAEQVIRDNHATETNQGSVTSVDALLSRFSDMFTVKKRTENGAMSQVNGLLQNDVLKQRLELLVDRLDWGMQTHSIGTVKQAIADIKTFIKRHYAHDVNEFNLLLEPFMNVEFPTKQNLSIVKLDEAIEQ